MKNNTVKYTPGPWMLCQKTVSYIGEACYVVDKNGQGIADTINLTPKIDVDMACANARLIAAAPDLLEACKIAVDCIDKSLFISGIKNPFLREARMVLAVVISKAEKNQNYYLLKTE